MGYFVQITDSNFVLPKENYEAAYKALCDLNQHDDLKGGKRYTNDGSLCGNDPRPEGLDYHPARWFAWMLPDYPKHLKSLQEVLKELGFELLENDEGIYGLAYHDKVGDEEVFLEELAPFVKDGSYICWEGEDGTILHQLFKNGKMKAQLMTGQV